MNHGTVMYVAPRGLELRQKIADRFSIGITGRDVVGAAAIKRLNPDFRWHVYKSGTDTAVGAPGYSFGPVMFLHFSEPTVIVRGGVERAYGAGASVRLYSEDRYAMHLATPETREAYIAAIIANEISKPFTDDADVYADGVFLDNTGYQLYNYGQVISGGTVAECGYVLGSREFQAWHWQENIGPFCRALRNRLNARGKKLTINCGGNPNLALIGAADYFFFENMFSCIDHIWPLLDVAEFDRLAHEDDAAVWYAPPYKTSDDGCSLTYEQAMMGNISVAMLCGRENSVLTLMQPADKDPNLATWERMTWPGRIMERLGELGEVDGAREMSNHLCTQYDNGEVDFRPRSQGDAFGVGTEDEVATEPGSRPLSLDGTPGDPVESIQLARCCGAILLDADPEPPGCDDKYQAVLENLLAATNAIQGAHDNLESYRACVEGR